jgi:hypothetical protein
MSLITDYPDEEQLLLMQGPRLAAIVVSAASPGRASETVAEGYAAISYAMSSEGEFLGNRLINSILYQLEQMAKAERKFADYTALASAPDAMADALAKLARIADLLDAKSDAAEAVGYKQWVMNAATAASEGGKEGGNFLGWGAVDVNDAERTALAEIARALRIQP